MNHPKVLRPLAILAVVFSLIIAFTHGLAAGGLCFFVSSATVYSINPPKQGWCYAWTGVSLADIFIPEVYADIVPVNSIESTAFAQSGVAVTDPILQEKAQSGIDIVNVPLWNDLDHTIAENLSDDTDTLATPGKVDTDSFKARNSFLNKIFGAADLATEMAKATPGNGDPMTRIKNRFGAYWMYRFAYRIMAIAKGILAENIATDSGDMVKNVSIADGNAATSANYVSADAIVDAVFTLGDQFKQITAIAMHSVPYQRLVKQQLIVYVRDADGTFLYETYLGKRIIVDDTLPVVAGGTSGFVYTTILFGAGAIGYGEGTPTVPAETYRSPLGGSGGGLEYIVERKTWLLHAKGFNWLDAAVVGKSPTLAELANPANWARKLERKMCPIAFLKTNG